MTTIIIINQSSKHDAFVTEAVAVHLDQSRDHSKDRYRLNETYETVKKHFGIEIEISKKTNEVIYIASDAKADGKGINE